MNRNQSHWKEFHDISGLFSLLSVCNHPLKILQDALREMSHLRRLACSAGVFRVGETLFVFVILL